VESRNTCSIYHEGTPCFFDTPRDAPNNKRKATSPESMEAEREESRESDEVYMEELRDSSCMPPDLVRSCVEMLDCNVDRMNMRGQCASWLQALGVPLHEQMLPWILVPYRCTTWLNPVVIRRAHFFCFLSQRAHKLQLPAHAYTVRYIGSYEGGWCRCFRPATY
jgi:hypothetical protein